MIQVSYRGAIAAIDEEYEHRFATIGNDSERARRAGDLTDDDDDDEGFLTAAMESVKRAKRRGKVVQ